MDFEVEDCPTRRDLEDRFVVLTSRFSNLTVLLTELAGSGNHEAFIDLQFDCQFTREEIVASHRKLADHRNVHKC